MTAAASTATAGVEIPASVTIPGDRLLALFVELLDVEDELVEEFGEVDPLTTTIARLWHATFGEMYRRCERDEARDCRCSACWGDDRSAATPLYRLALDTAESKRLEDEREARVRRP